MTIGNRNQKDLLKLSDFTAEELRQIIDLAADLKAKHRRRERHFPLEGKTLGLVFEHSSTRTRVAFEVGMTQLGGQAIFLSSKDTQIGRGESMSDTARVLSRYVNALAARLDSQEDLEELARSSSIPVINALTKERHPCQILADLLTVQEAFGDFRNKRVTYIGDSNNVSNSWIEASVVLGFPLTLCCPKKYGPKLPALLGTKTIPSHIRWETKPSAGVEGADVITTDVWVSMGTRGSTEKRKALRSYQVNSKLLSAASRDHIVLHCLPAHRGEEITSEVLDGPHSRVFDQAENKLHIQKAVLFRAMS